MMPDMRTLGLPDIELAAAHGSTVNPSNFAGHDLIVLFCPADGRAAIQELSDYNSLADQLAYNDAHMVAICDEEAGAPASRILRASDDQGHAWDAFSKCLAPHKRPTPGKGAVFLFGRGGCLRKI